jgi:cyclophilin family peptidyl-prolyl cis-trans isomerase
MRRFRLTAIIWFIVPVVALLAIGCSGDGDSNSSDSSAPPAAAVQSAPSGATATPTPGTRTQWDVAPPMRIDPSKKYTAVFTMDKGATFEVELFVDKAPKTVNNFVFLAREGYYDGVTFHRVIPGFMAQGGDPSGTGSGGPGYKFDSEFHPDARHFGPGMLAMANAGMVNGRGTNGSQFYFTYSEQHRLDGLDLDGSAKPCHQAGVSCHTVFGQIIGGMDAVDGLRERDPQTATFKGDVVSTIEIVEE